MILHTFLLNAGCFSCWKGTPFNICDPSSVTKVVSETADFNLNTTTSLAYIFGCCVRPSHEIEGGIKPEKTKKLF